MEKAKAGEGTRQVERDETHCIFLPYHPYAIGAICTMTAHNQPLCVGESIKRCLPSPLSRGDWSKALLLESSGVSSLLSLLLSLSFSSFPSFPSSSCSVFLPSPKARGRGETLLATLPPVVRLRQCPCTVFALKFAEVSLFQLLALPHFVFLRLLALGFQNLE